MAPTTLFDPAPARPDPDTTTTADARWHPHLVGAPEFEPGPPGRLLVVAAHPCDEVLAVGGLVADLADRGWRVAVVTVTDGPGVRSRRRAHDDTQAVALERLGVADARTDRLGLPAGDLVARCEALISALASPVAGSDLCLVPLDVDGSRDHEVVGRVARALADDLGVPTASYPLWAWLRATPGDLPLDRLRVWPLSVSTWLAKRHAIDACTTQLGELASPHAQATFLRPVEAVIA